MLGAVWVCSLQTIVSPAIEIHSEQRLRILRLLPWRQLQSFRVVACSDLWLLLWIGTFTAQGKGTARVNPFWPNVDFHVAFLL